MDVVKTDAGYISGTVLGEPDKKVHVYRGIPYAAPPVGDLRWKPPKPVVPWSGIRECTAFSAIAPQPPPSGPFANLNYVVSRSEDCLYLNVITPAAHDSDKLPVMVHLHGGGYDDLSGNETFYNLLGLPLKGVILVNVNTRLGPLGCLAHPLLSRESPNGVSGNYLFLDIIFALKWVQKNISSFGGDPDNVTIFGESGGSWKVINMMASPLAKGLFHRAIGESGSRSGLPLREIEDRGETLFAKLGVDKERDPLAAARAIPWDRIISTGLGLSAQLNLRPLWDSAVDGWFLPETTTNVFKSGKQNIVPFIMGVNLGEITGPGLILMPQIIPDYVKLFAGANKVGGKAYAYIFDQVPAGWKKDGVVATHAMILPYIFGDWDWKQSVGWAIRYVLAKPSGAKSGDPGFTESDHQVSETIMKLWANFAKTGNPSLPGFIDWPAYDEATDQYLYITESPEVRAGFSKIGQK